MKTKRILSFVIIFALLLSMLASCAGGDVALDGVAKVVIETEASGDGKYIVYAVELSKLENRDEGVLSLLEYIKENNADFDYSVTDGIYGAYVDRISQLSPSSAKNEYIGVYTTEAADATTGTEDRVFAMNLTFYYAGVGISSMTVSDGTVVLFRIGSY